MTDLVEIARGFVETHIKGFHDKRIQSLQKLKLDVLLKRKNPYLFRAKNLLTAADFVKAVLEAYLSSQEETLFGDFLESLAIHIAQHVHGGQKSSSPGIDLDFTLNGMRCLVAIKSGPNWGNSGQIEKMVDNFNKAKKILGTGNQQIPVRFINGCCYGIDHKPQKGSYEKICGQQFWQLISGDAEFYQSIAAPLGHQAQQRNEEFAQGYATVINKFSQDFMAKYCVDGAIDWAKFVTLVSGQNEAATPLPLAEQPDA